MGRGEITIPQTIHDKMVEHGRSCLPYEACGLLSGINHNVQSIWQLENEWKSDRRFFVRKKIVEETVQKIKQLNEQVLAVYHSHPTTAPVPSNYDITNHPDDHVFMVIISYKTRPPITKWYHIQESVYESCSFFVEQPAEPGPF
ncbi:M67 family metallopeptidase [Oceanobacillus rekensis]|uniref:M67 family metallopeptidase n=1 Tax=Oceanobacillus rekensis TaxID=937927 RepID=UPI000B44E4B6|nr:M67 family metallopeptidase [Oceanobacillus rekensis]